tara:strand:+ start:206 stop:373 length:168 start_codon:yes stop_codon:yes gene_type:complete
VIRYLEQDNESCYLGGFVAAAKVIPYLIEFDDNIPTFFEKNQFWGKIQKASILTF